MNSFLLPKKREVPEIRRPIADMEHSNPMVDVLREQELERRAKETFRYPYRVVCVYLDRENSDFPVITDTRSYCIKHNVVFTARQYDSETYPDDVFINRLPAFHFYYKRGHIGIHHYDQNPIFKLQCEIWEYIDKQRAKERAKQKRQETWNTVMAAMKSAFDFKRKSNLDLDASLRH